MIANQVRHVRTQTVACLLTSMLAVGSAFAAPATQSASPQSVSTQALSTQGSPPQGSPTPADIDKMTDHMVAMIPFGTMFDSIANDDPNWPLHEKPGAAKPEQLACMREELSAKGFRRYKRGQVEAYASAHPSRFSEDLALLDKGASVLFGKLVMAGAESERTGIEADPMAIMKDATPDQMASFMAFFSDPNYAELRKLSGLGDALSLNKSAEENESAGEQVGQSMATQLILRAMGACDVPTSVLFD